MKLRKGKCNVLLLEKSNPRHHSAGGWTAGRQFYQRSTLGSWWTTNWSYACNAPLKQKKPTASWAALRKNTASRPMKVLSTQPSWGYAGSTASTSGLPSKWTYHNDSGEVSRRWWRGWSIWESLLKKRLREDLTNVYKYLKGENEEKGARFFFVTW